MDSEKPTLSLQLSEPDPERSDSPGPQDPPSNRDTAFFAAPAVPNPKPLDADQPNHHSDLNSPVVLKDAPLALPTEINLQEELTPSPVMSAPMATLVVSSDSQSPRETYSVESSSRDEKTLSLEERVIRLEEELSRLKDTRTIETRVVARVQEKLAQDLGSLTNGPPSSSFIEISKRFQGMNSQAGVPRTISPRPDGAKDSWFVFEMLAEVRALLRMIVDPRYKMSWVGRVLPLVLLIAFLFPDYVISIGLPGLGSLLLNISVFWFNFFLKSIVQLLIGYVLFKVLNLEVRRYRQMSPDLPASLRL